MSDSTDNTKNLDSYGVWVKTPPQDATQASQKSETNIDAEMPDFSDLDLGMPTETTDSASSDDFSGMEEFSVEDFLGESDTPSVENSSDSGEEEISLDDFMDGDFVDPNPGATPAPSFDSANDGEISLDDFLDDSSSNTKEDDVADEEAMDIDLSFSDSEEVPTTEDNEDVDFSAESASENVEATDFSEVTDFDDMFDSIGGDTTPSAPTSDGTEEISLDDFTGNSDDSSGGNSDSSEEIDLADFGIDSEAEETAVHQDVQAAKKNQVIDYNLTISDEDEKPAETKSEESDSEPEKVTIPENATVVNNSILEQIMTELSGLKNDINNLKTDFETLKNQKRIIREEPVENAPAQANEQEPVANEIKNEIAGMSVSEESMVTGETENPFGEIEYATAEIHEPETDTENLADTTDIAITEESLPEIEIPETNNSAGFFENTDEDETIALSGDELENIMNTADFTETTEESAAEADPFETLAEEPATEENEMTSFDVPEIEVPAKEVEKPAETVENTEEDPFEALAEEPATEENEMTSFDMPEIEVPAKEVEKPAETVENTEEDPFATLAEEPAIIEEDIPDFSDEESALTEEPVFDEEPAIFEETQETAPVPEETPMEKPAEISEVAEETPSAAEINANFTDDNPFGAFDEAIEEIEEPVNDSNLSLDVENEVLEEPNLDDIEAQEIESEISIPKVDDFVEAEKSEPSIDDMLVESSSDDFMESVNESEMQISVPDTESTENVEKVEDIFETAEPAEEPSPLESFETDLVKEPVDDVEVVETKPDFVPAKETVESDFTTFDELLAPEADISETLSDENMDYLSNDENYEKDKEEVSIETTETATEEVTAKVPDPTPAAEPEVVTETTMEDPFPPIEAVPEADAKDVSSQYSTEGFSENLKNDVKTVLLYMDQLLENLPEDKIMEFAKSEQFTTYKRLFNELGLS